jgi:uncharacterized protein (TIGR03118 family)
MNDNSSRNRIIAIRLLTAITVLTVSACGSSGGNNDMSASGYAERTLVSDGGVAAPHTDANLVNPWGLVFNPEGFSWIANNHSQTSTLYDGNGVAQSLIVTLPEGSNGDADPNGIVFNGGSDFVVTHAGLSGPGIFIFSGEGGVIEAWSPTVAATTAIVAYDDGSGGAVYKGLALASSGGANFLYATDFHNAKVDVFDTHYAHVTTHGGFVDPALPAGYAPFGIQNIGGSLVVTYAKQQSGSDDEAHGAGLGVVDLFDTQGNLLRRVVSAGAALNAPWGIALAPSNFGAFSNALLIGDFGDGTINAYDATTGASLGALKTPGGQTIVLPGLWAIVFGNGLNSQPTNSLFYTAGVDDEDHGVYGVVEMSTSSSASSGYGG